MTDTDNGETSTKHTEVMEDTDGKGPMRSLRRHLEDWDVVNARAELSRECHTPWMDEHAWEIVPLVTEYLTPEIEAAGPHLTLCCQDLLQVCAERGNAKENLVAFMEQMDGFKSNVRIRRCLPGLATVLSKIKDKSKALSWSWAMATLYSQIKLVNVPENAGLEGEERLTIDLGDDAVEAMELIADLVTLLELLVASVNIEEGPESEDPEYIDVSGRRRVLRHFMLQLLGHPLAFLNLHSESKIIPGHKQSARQKRLRPEQSDSRATIDPAALISARQIVKMMAKITPNIINVVDMDKVPASSAGVLEEDKLQATSIGTFLYLILGEGVEIVCVPAVYSKLHLLHMSVVHICTLLDNQHEMCIHKGLLLLKNLLKSIPNGSVGPKQSDDPTHLSLICPLVRVCVYHNLQEMRSLAFECYCMFISIFSIKGLYKVFRHIFNCVEHSGIRGWTITQLKEAVNCSVSRSGPNKGILVDLDDLDEYRGDSFVRLVKGFLTLKHEEKTDLLDIYDEIIATINMFVYLIQVDKNNLAGIKDLLSYLKKYVAQLSEALRLSRAHYNLKLKNIGSNIQDVVMDCSVVSEGRELSEISDKEQKVVLNGALTTFDMIQYNLVRLAELVENIK